MLRDYLNDFQEEHALVLQECFYDQFLVEENGQAAENGADHPLLLFVYCLFLIACIGIILHFLQGLQQP